MKKGGSQGEPLSIRDTIKISNKAIYITPRYRKIDSSVGKEEAAKGRSTTTTEHLLDGKHTKKR